MRSAAARDFVQSYIEAWNEENPLLVADHLTADGVYHDVPNRREHHKKGLIELLLDEFSTDHNRYSLEGGIRSGQNCIAFQYSVQSASSETWYGAEFVDLEGERAVHIRDFYQPPVASQQAGSNAKKYVKSGLNDEAFERLKSRLANLMLNEQAYLNPDLTLPKLSKLVCCSVNHLSQVINSGFGMSFFDYLNQYRVEEAKRLLVAPDNCGQAIITVAYEVGFNSNSAFYTAFKKSCGRTPAQYRRDHQEL